MILMRIDKLKGKYCDMTGGQERFQYSSDNAGWFPVESMNFGFQTVTESAAGNSSGATQARGNGTAQQPRQSAPKAPPVKGGSGGGESFTTITVGKFVDGTTTQLMKFAMQDRKKTKADEKELRSVDFHFLHSVMGKQSVSERHIFPYMMIHLEGVLIKGWNITATGDDRPTETLELWYDKAAMRYWRTKDGLIWTGGDVAGWDQSKNEQWTPPPKDPDFFDKTPNA